MASNSTPDDTATHEPRVDVQRVAVMSRDHHTHEPVVGVAIAQAQCKMDVTRVPYEALQLRHAMATGGEIELIGLADELRNPGQLGLLKRRDDGVHLEAAIKSSREFAAASRALILARA